MKKMVSSFMVLIGLSVSSFSWAEWVNISHGLIEQDIQYVVAGMQDPALILVSSNKRVYRTVDDGASWDEVLTLRMGEERTRSLNVDAADHDVVYVCTDRGIYRSKDRGKTWNLFFMSPADGTGIIYCVANEPLKPEILWIGTGRGLIRFDQKSRQWHKVSSLPDIPVYSMLLNQPQGAKIVATSQGVYRNLNEGDSWERVFVGKEDEPDEISDSAAQQFGVEELSTAPLFSSLIFLPGQDKIYAATYHGVLEGAENATSWKPIIGATLPDRKINFIARSQRTFYIATDRGVFQWDEAQHLFHELYLGLGSSEIRSLNYNVAGDYLLAATKKGVYRLLNPDLSFELPMSKEIPNVSPHDVLGRFAGEPTVLEVQEAAIRYAEVSPKKIEDWRKAASRKALAPTLSLHQNTSTNDNIDIDRGGTADADKFIRGPQEKSADWYATASWDIGELIWNNDQTSIDSRSKLMVELRNDVLNEVTHLYYERRRLQVQIIMAPAQDLAAQLERQIRLEELTSGIDALTGGFLSKRLSGLVA